MSIPLSIIILAHKETETFSQVLASVKWAEEVIVLWSSSAPLKLHKAKVVKVEFPITDFAAVRNKGLELARNDWVFFVDSDEVVDPGAEKLLRSLLFVSDLSGIYIKRKDVFLGKMLKWGEVGNVNLLRILRKNAGTFIHPVHEVAAVKGLTFFSDITVQHFAHQSVGGFLEKVIRYSALEAQQRVMVGKKASVLEMICWPVGKFLQNYIIKFGFLDGWRGVVYAVMMSIHSFAVRALIIEQQDQKKTKAL